MEWMLVVKNHEGHIIFGPEMYSAGCLTYRRSYEITEGKIDVEQFIPPNKIYNNWYFILQIYLTLGNNEQVLFMEKRGFVIRSEKSIGLKWIERPDTEKPFRVTIRPDYCAYAWDEYGMSWFVDSAFPENPIAKKLDKDFSEWLSVFENTDIDNNGRSIINFSWEEFHTTGLALAKRLKLFGKDDIVIFYEKPYEDTFIVEDIQVVKIDE